MSIKVPPAEIDSARVLAYATVDRDVAHTGRAMLYVGGHLLGPVPNLVIALNNYDPDDFLLFHCNSEWNVLGAAGYSSFELAKEGAEIAYAGISNKWRLSA